MFEGANLCVLDLETAASADDCRHCGRPASAHRLSTIAGVSYCPPGTPTSYTRIGWDDHRALGLSIGCYYDYADSLLHWFDVHTMEGAMRLFVERQALLVTFNGRQFDLAFMSAVYRHQERRDSQYDLQVLSLCAAWQALADRSYDVLYEIWQIDPDRKYERGLNSLDALCKANGLPAKEMDGATAPVLWREGRIAEVVQYNYFDVIRTKMLFEMIMNGKEILRGDGRPIIITKPIIS